MEKFDEIKGIAAYLPMINVDTDMIIPKQFLKTITRSGLGKGLFFELRYDVDDQEVTEFVLNQAPYRQALIVIAGGNFGCGSSREHAVWALRDFGIRCVIAPSFGDIFYQNCFKNSLLPIVLPETTVSALGQRTQKEPVSLTIALEQQTIIHGKETIPFEIDEFHKNCLLNGLDDIELTLTHQKSIQDFEDKQKQEAPWLWA